MQRENKKEFYINELKSFHCNLCNSNLIMKYLNQSQQILLCSNKNVRIKYYFILIL